MRNIDTVLKAVQSDSNEVKLSTDLAMLEKEIVNVLLAVRSCEEIEGAANYFKLLDNIQTILARLIFKQNVKVSDNLREFVRDFDRIDDIDMRRYLFNKIKKGEYFLLPTEAKPLR